MNMQVERISAILVGNQKYAKGTMAFLTNTIVFEAETSGRFDTHFDWKSLRYSITEEKITVLLFIKQSRPCFHLEDAQGHKIAFVADKIDYDDYKSIAIKLDRYKNNAIQIEQERLRIEAERKEQERLAEEARKREEEQRRIREKEECKEQERLRLEAERREQERLAEEARKHEIELHMMQAEAILKEQEELYYARVRLVNIINRISKKEGDIEKKTQKDLISVLYLIKEQKQLIEEARKREEEQRRIREEEERKEQERLRLEAERREQERLAEEARKREEEQRRIREEEERKEQERLRLEAERREQERLADEELRKEREKYSPAYLHVEEKIHIRMDHGFNCYQEILTQHLLEFCDYFLNARRRDSFYNAEDELNCIVTTMAYHNVPSYICSAFSAFIENYDFNNDLNLLVTFLIKIIDSLEVASRYNYSLESSVDYGYDFKRLDFAYGEVEKSDEIDDEFKQLLKEVHSEQRKATSEERIRAEIEKIHAYILEQNRPVSRTALRSRFSRYSKRVMNAVLAKGDILDFRTGFIADSRIVIYSDDLRRIVSDINDLLEEKDNISHIKDIYEALCYKYRSTFTQSYITDYASLFGVIKGRLGDQFELEYPYIASHGVKEMSVEQRVRSFACSKDTMLIEDVATYIREKHVKINAFLDFIQSLNDKMLMLNREKLVSIYSVDVNREIAMEVERLIKVELQESQDCKAIRDLECVSEFPVISVPWDEWLIYSVLNKWCYGIYLRTTANQFKYSIPVVSLYGYVSYEDLQNIANRHAGNINIIVSNKIDDLDDLDSLIEDFIEFDDIDDLDDDDFDDFDFDEEDV